MKIVQINMARSMAVSVELRSYCILNNIDLALIQEPYTRNGRLVDLEDNNTRVTRAHPNEQHGVWAAIVVFNANLDIICRENLTTTYTVVLSAAFPGQTPIDFVSSYFQFRKNTADFVRELSVINNSLSNRIIIGADVNAFSPWWFDPRRNDKGRLVEQMVVSLNLTIENRNISGWSFHGARGNSNVDVTLSRGLDGKIINWSMDRNSTSSDHSMLTFSLKDQVTMVPSYTSKRFNDHKIDTQKLQEVLRAKIGYYPIHNVNQAADNLTNVIVETCQEVLPKRRAKKVQSRPPWWNQEVTVSRLVLNRAKRGMLREASTESRDVFKTARNAHVATIRRAKFSLWKKFADKPLDGRSVWGKMSKWLIHGRPVHKVPTVLAKQDGTYTTNLDETIELMLDELIPHSDNDAQPAPLYSVQQETSISMEELRTVVWKQKNKAPGDDGITAKIIRAAWPAIDTHLLHIVNKCLTLEIFPDTWKHANVVVLLKGKNKDPLKPKSYRPVSLLPVLGKILEDVICTLLERDSGHKLSQRQHGFRPGKSTNTALAEVRNWTQENGRHVLGSFLDISGAFDNVRWPILAEDMCSLGCGQKLIALAIDYLRGRTASYRIGSKCRTITLTRGCPQGSKFGPRLWNLCIDPLLRGIMPEEVFTVAYADDIAILAAGNTRKEVIRRTEDALQIATLWARERGLTFSREKSVMVPLKGDLVPGFTAKMGEHRIKSVITTKYLGLHMDAGFTFETHAQQLLTSSTDMFSRLKGVRKSKWGVSSTLALIIYKAVYIPRITYGANSWYPTISTKLKSKLESAQRQTLLAVTGAYSTTSTRALQVIAGVPPIQLQIELRINIEKGMPRQEAQDNCLEEWQRLWMGTNKGRWTYTFLPDVKMRIVTPLPFDHYYSQIISGHGDFNYKLKGFNLADEPSCRCGHQEDSAQHLLEDCPAVENRRQILRETMERLGHTWPYDNTAYTQDSRAWEALGTFARTTLIDKEKERAEQRRILLQD